MTTLIYPGSFDPMTTGHLDIAKRASKLCDKLIVAVLANAAKRPFFTIEERVEMARIALDDIENIEVESFDGLLADFYRQRKANAVIRGLRSESDFRFEAEIAAANKMLLSTFETCLMPCRTDLAFTSSSIVREVGSYGGDISGMVPESILKFVADKLKDARLTDLQLE